WDGRTLEWSVSSPPPEYNFAVIPTVHSRDPFWSMKEPLRETPEYTDIVMPRSTSVGMLIAGSAFLFGFGMIWYIWPLVLVGLVAVILGVMIGGFSDDDSLEYILKAEEVRKMANV